jgi:F-type H+-transporting ATPase subunit b
MLIDWFTVAAQAINFLILVWLMKRFLYKPILQAIDAREKRIAAELADADAKKAEAKKERDEFQHKNEEFDGQRTALLAKATGEAKAERERLLDEARKAAADWSSKRQETLRTEEQNLHQAVRGRIEQEVFAIARKALTDLAGTSVEQRMVDICVRRLGDWDGRQTGLLASEGKASLTPTVVRTAMDLPPAERAVAECAIKKTLGEETQVKFETAPELISGIEFTTNGHKVAWSIADYLGSLESGLGALLKENGKPEAKTEPKPEQPKPEAKTQ